MVEDKTIKVLFAMSGVIAITMTALIMGIDGTVLALGLAGLTGLGGYELRRRTEPAEPTPE